VTAESAVDAPKLAAGVLEARFRLGALSKLLPLRRCSHVADDYGNMSAMNLVYRAGTHETAIQVATGK